MRAVEQKFHIFCIKCGNDRIISYREKWNIEKGYVTGMCPECSGKQNGFKKGNWSGLHFGEGQKGHFQLHTEESKIKIRQNTPVRIGKENNKWKGGISKRKDYGSFMQSKRRARRTENGGMHTYQEWEELKGKYNYTCPCCGRKEPEITLGEDHIIPISKGGSDNIENIQPLCKSCNCRKYNKFIIYQLTNSSKI